MFDYDLMTPGPTNVHEDVLMAMAKNYTNPDLDRDFFELYKQTAQGINRLTGNSGETYILCGEGILGLEAACASFIEPGDRVLAIANGIFGEGFGDFAALYGAQVTYFKGDLQRGIEAEALSRFVEQEGPFKLATLVHCETPSGITNPVAEIGPVLRRHGILSIVDSVSAIGGEAMEMDQWGLDVVLCGSQKVLSAPPGLTSVSLSREALSALERRKTPIRAFYANLSIWKNWERDQWFPYTQPIHMIAGLKAALDRIEKQESLERHSRLGSAVRQAVTQAGLELFAQDHFANTVTTVMLPEGLDFTDLFDTLKTDHWVLIGGGFDFLENRIFRIGHMGENCTKAKLSKLFCALDAAFAKKGVSTRQSLQAGFDGALA